MPIGVVCFVDVVIGINVKESGLTNFVHVTQRLGKGDGTHLNISEVCFEVKVSILSKTCKRRTSCSGIGASGK